MKHSIIPHIASIVLELATSCSSVSNSMHQGEFATTQCSGKGSYGSFCDGTHFGSDIKAIWTRATDSSWAELRVITPNDMSALFHYHRPFHFFSHRRWEFDEPSVSDGARDPIIRETTDSLIIFMAFDFTYTEYFLVKKSKEDSK